MLDGLRNCSAAAKSPERSLGGSLPACRMLMDRRALPPPRAIGWPKRTPPALQELKGRSYPYVNTPPSTRGRLSRLQYANVHTGHKKREADANNLNRSESALTARHLACNSFSPPLQHAHEHNKIRYETAASTVKEKGPHNLNVHELVTPNNPLVARDTNSNLQVIRQEGRTFVQNVAGRSKKEPEQAFKMEPK